MGGDSRVIGLPSPVNPGDAVNKAYADGLSGGGVPSGTGSPEGVVTANVGGLYRQEDGDPGGVLWVKESGTGLTGWNRVLTLDATNVPQSFLAIPTLRILAGTPADYPPASNIFPAETPLIFISPTEIVYAFWYPDDGFGDPYHDIIATEKRITVGTTAPASPSLNDLWIDTN